MAVTMMVMMIVVSQLFFGFFPTVETVPPLVGGTYCRSFPLDGSDESLTVPPDGSDDLLKRSLLMGRMTY